MGGELQNLLLLSSPLGDDSKPYQEGTLHAIGLSASERLSAPYSVIVDAVSTTQALAPDALLRQPAAVTVRRKDGTDRFFHGIVKHVGAKGVDRRGRWEYQLELVPLLWFLDQTTDCRIFQKKTATQILRQLFAEHGVAPVDFRITGTDPVREYTTQFNETDLAFCQRIMQESGFFYYFIHKKSEHTLVVANSNQGFSDLDDPQHRVVSMGDNVDIIHSWKTAKGVSVGSVRVQDYDPTRPSTPVEGKAVATDAGPESSSRKAFVWPAMTTENSVARNRAKFAGDAAQAANSLGSGACHNPHFCPGFRFSLERDPSGGGTAFAIHAVHHAARDESWLGGTSPSQYDVQFSAFPSSVSWREPLTYTRPAMPGIFPAIVLGEGGEEIHADSLGRVKVRLLFDYREDTTPAMAIWARVLNPWAGNKWGWQHLPRVGTEVGVSFMSGDCDNPVILGGFYHAQNPPVFDIPAEKTKQGFRSRSTTGGGTGDYNELSFDDRLGQEMFLMRAQQDHQVKVERDQADTIGRDRETVVERNESLRSVGGDITISADLKTITISAKQSIRLTCGGSSITMTPSGVTIQSPKVSITGEATVTIEGGMVEIQP